MSHFPSWIEPMAATLTQERFTGPEWLFERKFDGIRLLAYKRGMEVELFSRNRLPQNCPEIARAIAALPSRELILDGEITWDRSSTYHVFDVMWIDGRDVMALPLHERRAILEGLPLAAPLVRVVEVTDAEPWTRAAHDGWEGAAVSSTTDRICSPPGSCSMKCSRRGCRSRGRRSRRLRTAS